MSTSRTAVTDLRLTALLWVAGPLLAWAVFPYVGYVSTPALELRAWADVARVAGVVAWNALPIGLITASIQVAALPAAWGQRRRWFAGIWLGHVIGLPAGFVLAVVMQWAFSRNWAPDLLTAASGWIVSYPTALAMLGSGVVMALVQAPVVLRRWPLSRAARWLWLFGGVLIWALGFIVSGYAAALGMPMDWRSPVAGAVIGLLSFNLLLFLRHTGGPTAERAAPQPAQLHPDGA